MVVWESAPRLGDAIGAVFGRRGLGIEVIFAAGSPDRRCGLDDGRDQRSPIAARSDVSVIRDADGPHAAAKFAGAAGL